MNNQVDATSSNLASALLNSKIRPREVVGYGVKIFHPSPSNYVTRSPGSWLCEADEFPTTVPWKAQVGLCASSCVIQGPQVHSMEVTRRRRRGEHQSKTQVNVIWHKRIMLSRSECVTRAKCLRIWLAWTDNEFREKNQPFGVVCLRPTQDWQNLVI